MSNFSRNALSLAKRIREDIPKGVKIPKDDQLPESEQILPFSLYRNTRGYIEKVGNQINGCYEDGWFDACAVMIRRLIEMLIIETYEKHGKTFDIKDASGDFFHLSILIDKTLSENSWNLSRNTKRSLPKLKDVGDLAAHTRRYNTRRNDIDKKIDDIRIVIEELIYLASLK